MLNAQNETTEEERNCKRSDPVLTSQLYSLSPVSNLEWHCIPAKEKFDAFIHLKHGEEKLTRKLFFSIFIQYENNMRFDQGNKKYSVITLKVLSTVILQVDLVSFKTQATPYKV